MNFIQVLIMTTILGIESTAHTFGAGIVKQENAKIKFLCNERDIFKPGIGFGIEPAKAGKHHEEVSECVLARALKKANLGLIDIDAIAYSAGPGLPPCLKAGLLFSRKIAKKYKKVLIPVNHCIAHIEVGKFATGFSNPIILYVSGGNTQVIGFAAGKYRVFGETLDIGVGNAIDTFAREIGLGFPGGPALERIWLKEKDKQKRFIELPYVVKGMDLCFSGILSDAVRRYKKNKLDRDKLVYSFQETIYAMLTEVTERAMAHTGKKECLLTGGVAASIRLREMLNIMCKERNAEFAVVPYEYAGDNGAMIAYNGLLILFAKE